MGPGVDWLSIYLEEDLGAAARSADPCRGDLTSTLFSDEAASARVVARQAGVVAGLAVASEVFQRLGATGVAQFQDGDEVAGGAVVLQVSGPVRAILAAERTALNIISRMSGIATRTRRLADALADGGGQAVVAGTRKTTPGFRAFEKEAIRIGGGDPHRMGLFEAMMIKDNHIAAAGDVAAAVRRLRAAHPDVLLEVEVESLEDGEAAAAAGAQWILIDNQDPETGRQWAEALRARHEVLIEASGGIRDEDLPRYAWADRISLGGLSLATLDFGLDWGTMDARDAGGPAPSGAGAKDAGGGYA